VGALSTGCGGSHALRRKYWELCSRKRLVARPLTKALFMAEGSVSQSPLVVFVVEDEVLIQDLLVDPLEEAG
jgi:hypothetical protein